MSTIWFTIGGTRDLRRLFKDLEGRELNVLPQQAQNVLVAASVISITLNPPRYKLVDPILRWVVARPGVLPMWG